MRSLAARSQGKAIDVRALWSDNGTEEFQAGNIELTGSEIEYHAQTFHRKYLAYLDAMSKLNNLESAEELEQLRLEAELLTDAVENDNLTVVARDIADIAAQTGA